MRRCRKGEGTMEYKSSVFSVAFLCLTLLLSAIQGTAHAVSAADGFNPNANNIVWALATQADGKILVGGDFTSVVAVARNRIARLNADGSLDTVFNPNVNGTVRAIVVQADGKILIGGTFTTVSTVARNRIARLNANGTLDTDFDPNVNGTAVHSIAVQADDRILIGGDFTTVGTPAVARNHIARLNRGGSLDGDFDPNANGAVYSIVVQPDDRILAGGNFTTVGASAVARNHIARLTANGSPDTVFDPNANNTVWSIVLQPDGKILVGGEFTTVGTPAVVRNRIARFNGADGALDTAFDPDVNNSIYAIALQADGKILAGGTFTTVSSAIRNRIARLNAGGTIDADFNPNGGSTIYSIAMQADGRILAGGAFTTVSTIARNRIARLNAGGTLDADFNSGAGSSYAYIAAIAVQPDGKVLIGGSFDTIGGLARNYIARLNPNASLDVEFNPNAGSNVHCIAVQGDGKILVGGDFTSIGGVAISGIARLNANGTLDMAFAPVVTRLESYYSPVVYSIAIQPDGRILMGGLFNTVNGVPRNFIARLLEDGTLDTEFSAGFDDYGGTVNAIAMQVDGKILVGGQFTAIGGVPRIYLARLHANGTLDTVFNANLAITVQGQSQYLYAIVVQADGKILIGGQFIKVGGVTRNRIARINAADGSLDIDFDPNVNSTVWSIALQADGKILIGGNFTTVGTAAIARRYIARLNTSGSLDTTFSDPTVNLNGYLRAIAVQPDAKVLIGGMFTTVSGVARYYIARLSNIDAAVQELNVSSTSTVTWVRGQASPEVWRSAFEFSTDGTIWTNLGIGTRISGGWQLTGLSLPVNANFYIRARGYAAGGLYGASGSLFESVGVFSIRVPVVQYSLTANAAGNGWGAVTSSIGGIGYSYPAASTGNAQLNYGATVTLTATAVNSTVAWSGNCSTTGGTSDAATCSITSVEAPLTVIATLSANPATAKIDGDASVYYTINSALDAITTPGKTLRTRALVFVEDVIMASPVAILIKGGYTDEAFTTQATASRTAIDGSLKIKNGTLRVERLSLR